MATQQTGAASPIYEPEDCDERYRQYLEHTPRRTGPTLIPIQV